MRLFRKFDQRLWCGHLAFVSRFFGIFILIFDAGSDLTVMTRYGRRSAAAAIIRKRGAILHPLMAFVADIRMIANLWLRPDSGFSDEAFLRAWSTCDGIIWLPWGWSPYKALVDQKGWWVWMMVWNCIFDYQPELESTTGLSVSAKMMSARR